MATERSENTSAVFAENAETNIPTQPVTGTGYRNAATPDADIQAGHLYNSIAPSEIANQVLYKITAILQNIEQRGIAGWNPDTVYERGAWVFGSDNFIYRAVQANPGSGRDPVEAANRPSHWERIEDVVVPNFATQEQAAQGTSPDTIISPAVLSQEFSRRLQGVGTGDLSSGRRVDTGVGLQGGGDLSVDRTISVRNGGIDTLELANNAVSTAKIQDGAVTSDKIAVNSVRTDELADGAVRSINIEDRTIRAGDIALSTIEEVNIANNAITRLKIAPNSVHDTELATNSVGTSQIQARAVRSSELGTRSVTDDKLSTQVTQAGRNWVRARQTNPDLVLGYLAVGTYIMARIANNTSTSSQQIWAGTDLRLLIFSEDIRGPRDVNMNGTEDVRIGMWRNLSGPGGGGGVGGGFSGIFLYRIQ